MDPGPDRRLDAFLNELAELVAAKVIDELEALEGGDLTDDDGEPGRG